MNLKNWRYRLIAWMDDVATGSQNESYSVTEQLLIFFGFPLWLLLGIISESLDMLGKKLRVKKETTKNE